MALGYYLPIRCKVKFNADIDALPAECDEVIPIEGTLVRGVKVTPGTGEVETFVTNDFNRDSSESMDLYAKWGDLEWTYAMLKTRLHRPQHVDVCARMNKIVRKATKFVCPVKPRWKVERAMNKRKGAYPHNCKSNNMMF